MATQKYTAQKINSIFWKLLLIPAWNMWHMMTRT